jgi:HSP20 family molecular chaperone IbpA
MTFSPWEIMQRDRDRFVPILSVHETPSDYEIELDLPFATEDEIEVRVHPHDILVGCAHAIDQEAPEDEAIFGTFVKRIHLDQRVDAAHVHKELHGGVLRICAHKLA